MALGNIDLTPQLVQAVRDAIDIVSIASEHTRLRKAGRRYQGLCPLHKEKTPSFSVDPVQGLFYCFGCGAGGDAIKLHMLLSGDDFPGAIESLAQRYGIPVTRRTSRRGSEGPDLHPALEAAQELFRRELERSELARGYLERREISPELAREFGLGYAPDSWEALLTALQPRVPLKELEAAGLVGRSPRSGRPYDRFRHRLTFPIHTASGRIVGFGGRTLGEDRAKYINTAETDQFHKSSLLYGLHQARRAIRDEGRVLLVEGYFDVLGAVAAGVAWTVASMGTSLTREQARLLARYADEVVVGYDDDTAGESAHGRSLRILLKEGLPVYRVRFGQGHDPDSLRLERGAEAVRAAVEAAQDSVTLELERLVPRGVEREPQRQARAAAEVRELVGAIPDEVLRYGYLRQAAERIGIPPEVLARAARSGGGRREPPVPSEAVSETASPRLVRSLEESVLELLLAEGLEVPEWQDLPSPEVFFDAVCRNIYQAYRTLYERTEGAPPDVRAMLAELDGQPAAIDRLAQIMVGGADHSQPRRLAELLGKLRRRWQRRRLEELAREIHEAERRGDPARLEELLKEKTSLSQRHHRGGRPGGG